jgi:hypothetical protein
LSVILHGLKNRPFTLMQEQNMSSMFKNRVPRKIYMSIGDCTKLHNEHLGDFVLLAKYQ